jgi:hypothetical protein
VAHSEHLDLYPNGKACHLCGRTLRDAADEHTLFTRVSSGIVFLHPRCAVELGEQLLREASRADLECVEELLVEVPGRGH